MPIEITYIFIILVLAAAIILLVARNKKTNNDVGQSAILLQSLSDLRKELQSSQNTQRIEVHDKLDTMHNRLVQSLTESSSTLQRHFKHTSGIIGNVTERLTQLDETNKQVLGFSEQLQSLENILKNPKQRGILGEYWLDSLLGQVLPPGQYKMQYEIGFDEDSGQRLVPDAVLFVKEMLIPIDAKFSLENYNRISQEPDATRREVLEKEFKADVKKRIDETSKYIQPSMGTTNFAFMFVPAEGVYHNLISADVGSVKVNSHNLIEYAFKKGVMIVSPTSFFAYLQTVLLGLKALQIEDSVKDIQKHAENLMRHLLVYEDYHNKLGKQIETVSRTYTSSSNELKKIDKDIYKITEGSAGKEMSPIELVAGSDE